jgi:hypothetical protein
MINEKQKIELITLELDPLLKEYHRLGKKIDKLIKERRKWQEQIDKEISGEISKDLGKISDEQWEWILCENIENETSVHLSCRDNILRQLGFGSLGHHQETHQTALLISEYHKSEAVKEGFKVLQKYMQPVTVTDIGHHKTTEKGLCFYVSGLNDNTTSVLYIHEKGDAILYEDRWRSPQKFDNFDKFVDWYFEVIKRSSNHDY